MTETSTPDVAGPFSSFRRRALALGVGLTTHATFLVAVSSMFLALYDGLAFGRGSLSGGRALAANALLALQFPLLHSFLLTARGRAGLARLFGRHGARLAPTTYAWSAALQILATFLLWSPSGIVWGQPQGAWLAASTALFFGAWLFLGAALRDGGLGLQTGWIGWTALWRDRRVSFPPLPQAGLFAVCRQPIYLGFALTLWTGPVWTPDRLLLATIWTTYCVVGPRHKELRYLRLHGETFALYQRRVPYMLPGRRGAA